MKFRRLVAKRGSITATAAATTATAAVSAAATAAAAFFTRLGFVDLEIASAEVRSVEGLDGAHHGSIRVHGHESEATWLAALTVDWQVHVRHLAVLGKQVLNVLLGRLKRQVAYIHFHYHPVVRALSRLLSLFPWTGFQITTEFFQKLTWQHSKP